MSRLSFKQLFQQLFLALAAAAIATAQNLAECRALNHHGKLEEARSCYARLAAGPDPYLRAEGLWGTGRYRDANDAFKAALKQHPESAEIRVRWGELFLERFNKEEAGALFAEALQKKKDYAEAYLGLARVASEGFGPKAVEYARKAAQSDPKLAAADELLAYLELEDNDPERAAKSAGKALELDPEALDAMAIRAVIDWLNDKPDTPWLNRILAINPVYGEAYATAGHFFVLNRRYTEAIAFYRKALDLDPRLWDARAQLGVNLMRLGDEDEARRQLEQTYAAGYRNAETVNSLRLLDSYKNFVTFKTPSTILRLQKNEAELLRPYFQEELDRAIQTYNRKYKMKLNGPVQLEVYPNHEDFAVRTMGMPGLGALGVTFGAVVAMDSPSGRTPGSFHWASTLWHELSHVYVLQATGHRVPRWFTEGMAVYEETAAAPDWGDRLDPETIAAIRDKKLLPIAKLDRGFVRPEYPSQVIVSYFQAGRICQFIAEKWGYDKLLAMMRAYAKSTSTPDVVRSQLGMAPEEFDKQFLASVEAQTKAPVEHFLDWKKGVKQMYEDLKAKKYEDVIHQGQSIRDYYTDYVDIYELMANAYLAKGDKAAARQELERYSAVGGRSPTTIKKLATLEEEAGDPRKAAAALARLNYIYPEDEELHRRLGALWLAQNNVAGAIREYQAEVALKPLDQAGAHYELARAYRAARRTGDAREEALLSLEAAPGFKPAQRLLLELSK